MPETDKTQEAAFAAILKTVREKAWSELAERKLRGYTEEQQLVFLSGMATMWRLCKMDTSPLFTYGPDSLPRELDLGPTDDLSQSLKRGEG